MSVWMKVMEFLMRSILLACLLFSWAVSAGSSNFSLASSSSTRSVTDNSTNPTVDYTVYVAEDAPTILRVGVLANHGVHAGIRRWQPMMNYLSDLVPEHSFEVVPLDFNEMSRQLLEHEIQFIVTNPGQYHNLSNSFPLSWLATMKSRKHGGTTFAIGSTIIVPHESDIHTLEDLKGSKIVASDPQALGGFQAARGLLQDAGFDTKHFFEEVRFLGFPLEPIVYQVRDGTVDAAITPFCTLEEMVDKGLVRMEDFRVIHALKPEGYDCEVSTPLYPNWSFAAAETVPTKITQQITRALFDLGSDHPAAIQAKTLGWTAPISQLKVIKLFQELQTNEAKVPAYKAVLSWMEKNKEWGGGFLLLFIVATLYHLWLEYKFRQKSEYLLATERELQEKALQVERLQSAAILGEIGAGLAHELNQPIASITQYSEGAMMQLTKEQVSQQDIHGVMDKINGQALRAGAVVHRIRGLLKRRQAKLEALDVAEVIQESLVLLEHEFERFHVEVAFELQGSAFRLFGDRVGLSQMLVNIFKNSLDAMVEGGVKKRKLLIVLVYGQTELVIKAIDTGTGLQKDAKKLMASFASTKEEGLGLGLAICKDVVTQHHGSLQIENCKDSGDPLLVDWTHGCIVSVHLPRTAPKGKA